ncbi:chaperonin GroEL [Candidatus Liberibacter asiaticus]|uniref:Chaperonin GroEL n=5 Tax=Liberibacter asiaticus TaxID=34021 RepID=C6XG19_LIBAP|nr:chaperonin GroEL [Candidatus Liberibacter asiaticus]ACT57322.1 chaperonin GroEL [Candidatus Liberibacter asiaticus str. psy62]AGH17087.1 chaperonin GroEL [Candidatus Liberibacter asiaticus str. gxpsy]ALK07408.1 chaperonin GroEL [Candidatus Liberibacter asiaticus]ASK52898.1 molecular chaperone GroEL [Candidatus Liberibacter asiaticus]AWL14217.1 chaperonin GroEL [Candidatus Liberibacter asiaticus]
MAAKDIKLGTAARDAIAYGVNTLAEAVKCTLGPKGRCVIIGNSFGAPRVTKDGVTVAKSISFKNHFHEVGARMIRDVATNTEDSSGDGTTTATCLAQAIYNEGRKYVTAGLNPMDIKRGIDLAVQEVVEYLKANHKKVGSREEIIQVATISANGDREIGEKIAYAMEQIGPHGIITIDQAKTATTEVRVVQGMQIDRGYISPYFVTSTERMTAEVENPYILIYDKKISALQPLLPILESATQSGRPLCIIAEDVEGDALATLVVNRVRCGLPVLAVKAPAFGDRRKEVLRDIAAVVGATVISEEIGLKLEKATIADLGSAKKVVMSKDDTTIVGGNGPSERIEGRINEIQKAIEDTKSDYDRDKLKERLAKLAGGVAVLEVGDVTEAALGEKKDRYQDSLDATRAASDEGIVPGGGIALVRAAQALSVKGDNEDQCAGIEIVRKALSYPCRQIIKNAGDESELIVSKIQESKTANYGYNAQKSVFGDMFEMGIIDPVKVVRNALQSAGSLAGMMLITEAVVVDAPKDETASPQMPAGGGMGGGMGGMDMMM